MPYELIALDMDGTLLDSRKEILPSSVAAIKKARAAGKQVAVCSGRCPQMVAQCRDNLPGLRYSICCAGAVVYDLEQHETLSETDIDPTYIAHVLDIADAQGLYMLEATSGTGVLMEEREIEMAPSCHVGIYQQLYRETSTLVADAHECARTRPVSKLNLHFQDVDARDRTWDLLQEGPQGAFVTQCETSSLELTAPHVDKGTGLAALCRLLGIGIEKAIAVGDADNDLAMLRAAGLGVAMGNANENARAAASVSVADNDHGGVAEAIERFLLA